MMEKEYTNPMEHINESSPWQDITRGGFVLGSGISRDFNTGDWRTHTPVWKKEQCKQCLLCFPVCPDSSIPVSSSKRDDFDMEHCKGCAICAKVCPFGAIEMTSAVEEDRV